MDQQSLASITQWLGTGSINIFGLPLAGKDTHGKILAADLGGVLLSGGQILRQGNTPRHVIEAIDKGNLAPTDEYKSIVLPYLSKQEYDNKPLILSAVGRRYGEEPAVIQATTESGHPLKAVIFLDITHAELIRRFRSEDRQHARGHRTDDVEHVVQKRIDEFHDKTLPVIRYYEQAGLLIRIDGTKPLRTVTTNIYSELLHKASEG